MYFSGHGFAAESEFFFCFRDFDARKPNQTGLSNTEFYQIVRAVSPELLVRIVDACQSGAPLIKSDASHIPVLKDGLKDIVQISSCLQSQSSLTGDPLSEFTKKFLEASLRKTEGPVYYTDLTGSLRDAYLDNNDRMPYFANQGAGRAVLADDASRLAELRTHLEQLYASDEAVVQDITDDNLEQDESLLSLLQKAEEAAVTSEQVSAFVNSLFDGIISEVNDSEFSQYFDIDVVEHKAFREENSEAFIIRVLSREKRPDHFVTADIIRKPKKRSSVFGSLSLLNLYDDQEVIETHSLELNCPMERCQLKITFTPKYVSLQQLKLVLTCAPSLNDCYVFEMLTQHARTSWAEFDAEGKELVRQWFKRPWPEDITWLVEGVVDRLDSSVREYLETAAAALGRDD